MENMQTMKYSKEIMLFQERFIGTIDDYRKNNSEKPENLLRLFKDIDTWVKKIKPKDLIEILSFASNDVENVADYIRASLVIGDTNSKKIRISLPKDTLSKFDNIMSIVKTRSKKDVVDSSIDGLFSKIPIGYMHKAADIKANYAKYLHYFTTSETQTVSLTVSEFSYEIFKSVAQAFDVSQGHILHVALSLMHEEILEKEKEFLKIGEILKKKRELLRPKLEEIIKISSELLDIAPEDSGGLDLLGVLASDLIEAIDYRIEKKRFNTVLSVMGEQVNTYISLEDKEGV